eukprot:gene8271-96_t
MNQKPSHIDTLLEGIQQKFKNLENKEFDKIHEKLGEIGEKNEEKYVITNKQSAFLHRRSTKYQVQESMTFNIVIIGKTNVGKTTFYHQLRRSILLKFNSENTPFSNTREPTIRNLVVSDDEQFSVAVNFIDNPGMFEVLEKEEKERSNEILKNMTNICIKREITKVHLILFTIPYCNDISKSLEAIKICYEHLSPASKKISGVLITHCEDTDVKDREDFISNVKKHKSFPEIEGVFEQTFFSGLLNINKYNNHEQDFNKHVKKLEDFRSNFFDYVFKNAKEEKESEISKGVNISETKFMEDPKKNCQIM